MRYTKGVSAKELRRDFRELLQQAEIASSVEFFVTSGYREGDTKCHGHGRAVDLACGDSQVRLKMVRALIQVGFTRIGLYSAHVHVDTCESVFDFPEKVLWLGGASQ